MGEAVDRLELKLSLVSAFKRRTRSGKVAMVKAYERSKSRDKWGVDNPPSGKTGPAAPDYDKLASWLNERPKKSVEQLNNEFDDDLEGVPFPSKPIPGSHPDMPVTPEDLKGFEKHVKKPNRIKDDADEEEHLRRLLKKAKSGGALTKKEATEIRMYGGQYGPVDSY